MLYLTVRLSLHHVIAGNHQGSLFIRRLFKNKALVTSKKKAKSNKTFRLFPLTFPYLLITDRF